MNDKVQIAVYYFPNYHPDPRNAHVHGEGWTEWELVRHAHPRFQGHDQPRIPQWGYEDESNPQVMAKKMAAATDHAIDAFIFDWYYYNDGPFLERALEQGFLQAPNNDRLRFALMWANHDWTDVHPARLVECRENRHHLLYPGAITRDTFERMTDYVIERYFLHPAYWKIDGAPYFSIYDLPSLVRGLGGVDHTARALSDFRDKTRSAGFPDLHLNQVLWITGILPGETEIKSPEEMLKSLGFDSFTSYVWVHHAALDAFPESSYAHIFEQYLQYWDQTASRIHLPYFPNASVGWDPSPRTVQSDGFFNAGYPFTPCISGNTPQAFQQALRTIRDRMDQTGHPKIVTVNSWNEWTEGSYLEPDTRYGMGYLEAIRSVFGS